MSAPRYEILRLVGKAKIGRRQKASFAPCDPPRVFESELECAKLAREICGPHACIQGMSTSVGEHWLGVWKRPLDLRDIKQGGNELPPHIAVKSTVPFDQKVWASV